jgi:Neuraminidase (sialidase)
MKNNFTSQEITVKVCSINKLSKFLCLKTLLFVCPLWLNAQELLQKTTVWEQGENNTFAHFVYGLCATSKGTILAFAEARIINGADDGAHHIVLKRSTDQGISFSPSIIVVASDNGKSFANPTTLQDRSTGTIFLFYALNDANKRTEVFYIKSVDDGQKWSQPISVTDIFTKNTQEWTFHLPGPGHGVQLKNNRLLVPIWHRKSISFPVAKRNYGVNCLYSDDHGTTWKLGGNTPVGELNESQVVEQRNGDLLLIGRTINAQGGSHFAKVWSKDKGESWSSLLNYDKALLGPACDIGLTRMNKNMLLVSQPADEKKRKDLTIRMSKNEGKTWELSKLLEPGAATYSDLALLPDETVICLYGHGGTGHMPNTVSLARFNKEWLLK